jgi:hypothetical protein
MFHTECITQWFFKKAECPMCRKTFLDDITNATKEMKEERKNGESSSDQEGDKDVIFNERNVDNSIDV